MIDFVSEITDFIVNLVTSTPDIFTHLFSFLNDAVDFVVGLFESGEIILAILVLLILIKIVGHIREAI